MEDPAEQLAAIRRKYEGDPHIEELIDRCLALCVRAGEVTDDAGRAQLRAEAEALLALLCRDPRLAASEICARRFR